MGLKLKLSRDLLVIFKYFMVLWFVIYFQFYLITCFFVLLLYHVFKVNIKSNVFDLNFR